MLTINKNISPLLSRIGQDNRFGMQKYKNLFLEDPGDTVEFSTVKGRKNQLNELGKKYIKEYGKAAILAAAYIGDIRAIEELHNFEPKLIRIVNKDGCNPLHIAASRDNIGAIIALNGLDYSLIKGVTKEGKSVLDLAKDKGHTRAVEILERLIKENKSNVDSVLQIPSDPERTEEFQRFMKSKPKEPMASVLEIPSDPETIEMFKQFMNS